MPEYLAPGVFVEEVSYRAKSIEGVGTSVAGFVGPTRTGPLRGTPEVVTSFAEFERIFGDVGDLSIGGEAQLNHTALAAQAFFGNGGKQLYVARVYSGTAADDTAIAESSEPTPVVTLAARFPGAAGNLTVEVNWRASENLLQGSGSEISARAPIGGVLAAGSTARVSFPEATDLSAVDAGWTAITSLLGRLDAAGTTLSVLAAANEDVDTDTDLALSALDGLNASLNILTMDIDVLRDGDVVYSFADIGTESSGDNTLAARLPEDPDKRSDQLAQPIFARLETGNVLDALFSMFDSDAIDDPDPLTGPRYLITLEGGSDGDAPGDADYAGETNEVIGSTGLAALAEVEDISIVATPAAAADAANHQQIVVKLQQHCHRMRYRVGIVDSRQGMSISEIQNFRSQFSDSRLALYYPWVVSGDPRGIANTIALPPSGFMAGIYARTDVDRGVHKSPANVPVFGALRFNQNINKFQQELLNPMGINCLRSFPGRGHRVWGGRTLAGDPEWKYLNVRRYFLFLERSIEKGTQWVVFEPNGEALWANVRTTIDDFLFNEWKNGHLLGSTPESAYFVRCDRSTMTQNDIDNGRLVCEVGVAPLRPAEFVIFRIGQKTADA